MPKRYKIDCIVIRNHYDPHSQISHFGGPLGKTGRYKRSVEEVITEIEQNRSEYYVAKNGHEEVLTVIESRWGNRYIGSRHCPHALEGLLACRENGETPAGENSRPAADIENQVDTQEAGKR